MSVAALVSCDFPGCVNSYATPVYEYEDRECIHVGFEESEDWEIWLPYEGSAGMVRCPEHSTALSVGTWYDIS